MTTKLTKTDIRKMSKTQIIDSLKSVGVNPDFIKQAEKTNKDALVDYMWNRIQTIQKEEEKAMNKTTTEPKTTEKKAEKKARKTKKTPDVIIASIPKNDRLTFDVNAKGAVHVKCGKYRIFGHSGPVIVVTREDFLPDSIPKDARNYGFRVDPTEANMKAIIDTALSVIDKKAEAKAKAEAERKAKAEKAKAEKAAKAKTEKTKAEKAAASTVAKK